MAPCVFCSIVAGAVPAHVVLDDDVAVAFLDTRPLFAGHVLLVPRAHHETLTDLPSGVIDDAIAAVTSPDPGANAVEFRHWGGALARPGLDAGPAAHRDWQFSLTIDGPDGLFASYATGASFLNWLHDTSRTHTAFTSPDYALLRDLKRTWDPDNALGLTHNLAPATAVSTRTAG